MCVQPCFSALSILAAQGHGIFVSYKQFQRKKKRSCIFFGIMHPRHEIELGGRWLFWNFDKMTDIGIVKLCHVITSSPGN